jgi:hypothetical protein
LINSPWLEEGRSVTFLAAVDTFAVLGDQLLLAAALVMPMRKGQNSAAASVFAGQWPFVAARDSLSQIRLRR